MDPKNLDVFLENCLYEAENVCDFENIFDYVYKTPNLNFEEFLKKALNIIVTEENYSALE